MKRLLILLAVLFAFASASAQSSTVSVQSAKTFYKASTVEDTSSTLTIGSYPNVYLHTTSLGSDSSLIYANIDAYINSVWVNNIVRDTLSLGRPTGYVLAGTAKGQVKYRALRTPSSDLVGSASAIRIRNKHASGSGDSNAALTYTQKLLLRKP
jgi:hypothetical protein